MIYLLIDDSWPEKNSQSSATVKECLKHACDSSLIPQYQPSSLLPNISKSTLNGHQLRTSDTMEHIWQEEYVKWHKQWKSAAKATSNSVNIDPIIQPSSRHVATFCALDSNFIANTDADNCPSELILTSPDDFTGLPGTSVSIEQPTVFQPEMSNVDSDCVADE